MVIEEDWLSGTDPEAMLEFIAGKDISFNRHRAVRTPVPEFLRRQTSDRKFRLLAVAWYRGVWPLLPDVGRRLVEVAERQADSPSWLAEVAVLQDLIGEEMPLGLWSVSHDGLFGVERAFEQILTHLARLREGDAQQARTSLIETETAAQAAALREIFGNPLRPVVADPCWLTANVVGLAASIYEERAFDRLPILADALIDTGCDSDEVIDHCRGRGPHVRGCWVVDMLLGKG